MNRRRLIENPFRPGAGHLPPMMAGRVAEQSHFKRLLHQSLVTENILITGLRGFGKTVLLSQMRSVAEENDWLWVGNDLSESSTLSEDRLALRIMTDLAQAIAARIQKSQTDKQAAPLRSRLSEINQDLAEPFTFDALKAFYEKAPGLPSDKLRAVMTRVSEFVAKCKLAGFVLAYDEAQCLSDNAPHDQFPMSMLIETVSLLQKKSGVSPCLLVLCGLPQVFDALTSTRTYTERMFHVMPLERLSRDETLAALGQPTTKLTPPLHISRELIWKAAELSAGYPYLIQFFGRELIDQVLENGGMLSPDLFPGPQTMERLDAGLFAARWNRTTDKQREFLGLIARRPASNSTEFSAKELTDQSERADNNHAQQMLAALCDRGMIYRTRHGRYAFTIPLSEMMILRRLNRDEAVLDSWEQPRPASEDQGSTPALTVAATRQKRRNWFGLRA